MLTTTSFRRLVAVTAAGVVVLSGCGGGGGTSGDGATESPLPVRITAIREGAVAFVRDVGAGPRVYLLNRDGSGATPLFAPGRAQGSPEWAPGGESMAFDIGCGSNIAAVYVVDPYGKKRVVRAIPKSVDGCAPAWAPSGRTLAFVGLKDGTQDIWVSQRDGSGAHRLTDDAAADADPSWSPDGKRIAFASDPRGNSDLYVMSADGSGARVLYASPDPDADPAWSPDGRWVVFSSASAPGCGMDDEDCAHHIWIVRADGSGARQLTAGSSHDVDPVWSPDGTRIAFASDRDGDFDVYVVDVEGGESEQVTNDPGSDLMLTWGDRPLGA
jgi:Tol biopolymer transport system component